MSKRSDILAEIGLTISGVQGIDEVQVNRATPVDVDTVGFPCAFVYSGNSNRLTDGRSVIGYENWEWSVLIEVWVKEGNPEEMLALVHAALFANEQLSGLAATSYLSGVDMMVVDIERQVEAMLLQYTVEYRHARGVP